MVRVRCSASSLSLGGSSLMVILVLREDRKEIGQEDGGKPLQSPSPDLQSIQWLVSEEIMVYITYV